MSYDLLLLYKVCHAIKTGTNEQILVYVDTRATLVIYLGTAVFTAML